MKISLKWIHDFVDISEFLTQPEKLADLLTHKGLEVEAIENKAQDFKNVVVGHILERGQHPNADRLTLCQVTTGEGKVHQIVCGATNHKAGDRVVVALPGAILPGNFEIKLSKIRNVESQGMLCSDKELGISEESQGIRILPPEAPIGKSFAEYMGFDDVVMELKVTPNRADCLSHWGLSREIACLLNKPLKKNWETNFKTQGDTTQKIGLDVRDKDLCPRYTGRYVEGVKVGPSPDWMKRRLEASGMKSINNIVDITNYVMLELGQPLHAFDAREIKGSKIIISKATPGEKFKTLDSTDLELKGSELMIRDAERPVALAGVVGGLNSGIQNDTQNVFVESAYFTIESVRKTARLHGVQTESAYRFSRGVDPSFTLHASNRCVELILELAGGTAYGNPHDSNPNPIQPHSIEIKISDLEERLGYKIQASDFETWMQRLGCSLQAVSAGYKVQAPLYRPDLVIKEDLIEEFARLQGYEHIPEKLPIMGAAPSPHALEYVLSQRVHQLMRSEGYSEAFNFSFISEKTQNAWIGSAEVLNTSGFQFKKTVKIKNPLSDELNVMRQTLFVGLFQSCLHNLRHTLNVGRVYEQGFVFDTQNEEFVQNWNLGVISWGSATTKPQTASELFFEAKNSIETFFKSFLIKSYQFESLETLPFLHPGQTAAIKVEGKRVGYIGCVHPVILDQEKVRVPVVFCELNLDLLLKGQPRKYRTKSISKFPMVERDLAFVVSKDVKAGEVATEIQKAGGTQLKSVHIFDVFEGGSLKEGERSIAYRLVYQDMEKTLTDEDLKKLDQTIINAVSHKYSISVR